MAFPKYNKEKRKKAFKKLPVGAYVVKILDVKEEPNKSGSGRHLTFAFDIAEGEYKDFYMEQWNNSPSEDKKWPNDGKYYLNIPDYAESDDWNTFFGNLEISNNGFVFDTEKGDLGTLVGKIIGGKFHIEQSLYQGNIYDHVRLKWTCTADEVRTGTYGTMPKDKLITNTLPQAPQSDPNDFLSIPDSVANEVPFL